jgi:hypothetical protein
MALLAGHEQPKMAGLSSVNGACIGVSGSVPAPAREPFREISGS